MSNAIERTLRHLRNKRDLRAEMVDLAAMTSQLGKPGRLVVHEPWVASATVRAEWDRVIAVLSPVAAQALTLRIVERPARHLRGVDQSQGERVALDRPNYKHEVIRLLVGASLEGAAPPTLQGLIEAVGVSQTPIRAAVAELRQAGVVSARTRSQVLAIAPHEISLPLLAAVKALPQTIRLRFAQGARLKTPAELLERLLAVMSRSERMPWANMALSGIAAARQEAALDIVGVPRLDIVAHVRRDAEEFDVGPFRELDDGLELEPSVLAPAPVVITLVRGAQARFRDFGHGSTRTGAPADLLLSLLDQGLRDQAIAYARAIRS